MLELVDYIALEQDDADFLLNKGVSYYQAEDYENAIEYYRLAAILGHPQAISNLGYCYMYGRSIDKNMSLALAYFKKAASLGVIDSIYKLATFYFNGYYVEQDPLIGKYYLDKALDIIFQKEDFDFKLEYPSVFFTFARELIRGEIYEQDLDYAFIQLLTAQQGYEICIANGDLFYESSLQQVNELLDSDLFIKQREDLKEFINNEELS